MAAAPSIARISRFSTGDLLTGIGEALQPPAHLTSAQLTEWHSHTLRGRLPLIREALRIAREGNDAESATLLVDQAIAEQAWEAARVLLEPDPETRRGRHRAPRRWKDWPAVAVSATLLFGVAVAETIGQEVFRATGLL